MTTTPPKYWWDGAHECDDATFKAFLDWASTKTKVERSVALICEPPAELFYDLAIPYDVKIGPEIIAGSTLMSEYPSLGITDPRPADQRPNHWWRDGCKVHRDWWARYQAEKT